jgi:presenilin-like A22 family membrane protease
MGLGCVTVKSSPLRGFSPFLVVGALFVVVDFLALLLAGPFSGVGLYAFEDAGNPVDVLYFVAMMLVSTGIILALRRFMGGVFVRWIMIGVIWFSLFSTLYSLSWLAFSDPLAMESSALLSFVLVGVLVRWPRWYVIDAAAILLGSVTTAVIGISLTPPLVAALLLLLAVYDAVSVYKTKHMLTLAEAILNSGLPLVLIVPRESYREGEKIDIVKGEPQREGERRAFYMGLGDLVLPGCLAVSVYATLGFEGLPVIFAVVLGTIIGFAILSVFVARGKPQAGLPLLCGGAVLGYVFSSYFLFGSLVGFG